jgi:hypothetical protein
MSSPSTCRRLRATAHQLHQDMREKRQKMTSASWLRPVCGGFHKLIRFNCAHFFCVMSQTSCLDCYMSWRMPVCGLPNSSSTLNVEAATHRITRHRILEERNSYICSALLYLLLLYFSSFSFIWYFLSLCFLSFVFYLKKKTLKFAG